jgi:hypothetical protein
MKRQKAILFIQENSPFYKFVNFDGHSDEQVMEIKLRIEKEKGLNGTGNKKPRWAPRSR